MSSDIICLSIPFDGTRILTNDIVPFGCIESALRYCNRIRQ